MTLMLELESATHVGGRVMVHARLVDDGGAVVANGWFEPHRLCKYSPTGVWGIFAALKRDVADRASAAVTLGEVEDD